MGKLIYSMITSLDGYVADKHGGFDWAQPDEELHTFINEVTRPVGTHLYGRRMVQLDLELLDERRFERSRVPALRRADLSLIPPKSGC
jgi:RibD C-terminal domain